MSKADETINVVGDTGVVAAVSEGKTITSEGGSPAPSVGFSCIDNLVRNDVNEAESSVTTPIHASVFVTTKCEKDKGY